MSKKTTPDLSSSVMDKIHTDQVKMRPKVLFVAGSLLLGLGVAIALISAVIFFAITSHNVRIYAPHQFLIFGNSGISPFFRLIPWFPILVSSISIIGGISLLKRYDLSYKKSFLGIVTSLVVAIFIIGFFIDRSGINDLMQRVKPFRPLYVKEFVSHDFTAGTIENTADGHAIITSPEGVEYHLIWNDNTALPRGGVFQSGDMIRAIGEWHGATFSATGIIDGPKHIPPVLHDPSVRKEMHRRMQIRLQNRQ